MLSIASACERLVALALLFVWASRAPVFTQRECGNGFEPHSDATMVCHAVQMLGALLTAVCLRATNGFSSMADNWLVNLS